MLQFYFQQIWILNIDKTVIWVINSHVEEKTAAVLCNVWNVTWMYQVCKLQYNKTLNKLLHHEYVQKGHSKDVTCDLT